MKKNVYLMFREGALESVTGTYIKKMEKETGLDYRTIRALTKIINNESGITKNVIETLADKDFYTYENCVTLAKEGLTDLIPSKYFYISKFLEETKIDCLPDYFLSGDDSIVGISIAPEIKKIGYGAFMNCKGLNSIHFEGRVEEIGACCFKGTRSLEKITLPNSVTEIGEGAFEGSGLKEFTIPSKVTLLKTGTFKNCKKLKEIEYRGKNFIKVEDKCFMNCERLLGISFIAEECMDKAFYNCTSLNSIVLSTPCIGRKAFYNCVSLYNISFEKKIPSVIKKQAFDGCFNLCEIVSDGCSYELREAKGYTEITRMIKNLLMASNEPRNPFTYKKSVASIVKAMQ